MEALQSTNAARKSLGDFRMLLSFAGAWRRRGFGAFVRLGRFHVAFLQPLTRFLLSWCLFCLIERRVVFEACMVYKHKG